MQLRRNVGAAFLGVSLAASAGAQDLRSKIASQDINLYARLLAMTDSRQLDMPLVERALASKSRTLRAAATMSIGQVGPDQGRTGAARLRTR